MLYSKFQCTIVHKAKKKITLNESLVDDLTEFFF